MNFINSDPLKLNYSGLKSYWTMGMMVFVGIKCHILTVKLSAASACCDLSNYIFVYNFFLSLVP